MSFAAAGDNATARNLLNAAWRAMGLPRTWLPGVGNDTNGDSFGLLAWASAPGRVTKLHGDQTSWCLPFCACS